MPTLQLKGGTTTAVAAVTPAVRELVLDTTQTILCVGDGTTVGGKPLTLRGTRVVGEAVAGTVGEHLSADNSAAAVNGTSGTASNVTSLVLTPGDWEVSGVISFNSTTAALTAFNAGISSTSATLPPFLDNMTLAATLGMSTQRLPVPTVRFNVSANTTIYMVATPFFAMGTVQMFGKIRARRVR